MFANAIQSLTSDNLPVNWFDVVVVLILGFGLFRGRKNGMSKEILPLFQWLAVILVSGLFYATAGPVDRPVGGAGSADQQSAGLCHSGGGRVFVLFAHQTHGGFEIIRQQPVRQRRVLFRHAFRPGPVRLHADFCPGLFERPPLHLGANRGSKKYQERWYGAHLFPDLYTVQSQVFKNPSPDLTSENISACC